MKRGFRWGGAVVGACAAMSAPGDLRAEPAAPAGTKATLAITATGFEGTKGQAIVAVYATKDTWLKVDRAYRIKKMPISGGTVVATFTDLPPGIYAVSVIHDANSNGKLDMHWFPVPGPDEGAGVSNDAKAVFGPPSFDDARFQLSESSGAITIKIRY